MNIVLEKCLDGIGLKELSIGDWLGFSKRIETVIEVKPEFSELYTQRFFWNGNFSVEKRVYELDSSGIITADSKGRVYETRKIKN